MKEFDQWMERNENNYINRYGIVFNRTPHVVFVDAPWPGSGCADFLSIFLLCANGKDLFKDLNIEAVNDLEKLEPEILLNLFHAGNAMVLCTTANGETLQFQKGESAMVAIIDGVDMGHEVKEQLVVPGDFIRYTNDYFLYMREINKEKQRNNISKRTL